MRKGVKSFCKRALKLSCFTLSLFLAVISLSVKTCAAKGYISEVTVAVGENAREALESNGYSVLFQSMNLVSDDSSTVVLGYKTGPDAITDFIVSTQKSDTITYGSASYTLVSDINLNEGTSGTPIYLYSTKDSSAGSKITSLDTVSGFSDKDEVISLKNDGSSPVRMNDGTLANFDSGISDNQLYLIMYRSEAVRQYISDAYIVTGTTKSEAINTAASKGCDFYLDYDISGNNNDTVSYIAYRRTGDKNNAISHIDINGSDLKYSKSPQSGSYLLDISDYKLFGKDFELGKWAGVYIASDKSVSKTSDSYKALSSSKEACSCVLTGNSGIYAVYLGSVESNYTEPATVVTTTASEAVTDEFYDIDKTVEQTEVTDNSEVNSTASVITDGSTKAIICLLIIVILTVIAAGIYIKRRKEEKNEKNN